MAENKTKATRASVIEFIAAVESDQKRKDAETLIELFKELTGEEPVMWGPSIIGFGRYHYKYESGREGDMPLSGFSPRKTALTLYIMPGFSQYDEHLSKLGKFKTGKSCLYIKKLADIDFGILTALLKDSIKATKEKYPG